MKIHKKFQELNLSDSFLFGAYMGDKENCRAVLEVLLGIQIPVIHSVNTEAMMLFYPSDIIREKWI